MKPAAPSLLASPTMIAPARVGARHAVPVRSAGPRDKAALTVTLTPIAATLTKLARGLNELRNRPPGIEIRCRGAACCAPNTRAKTANIEVRAPNPSHRRSTLTVRLTPVPATLIKLAGGPK